MDDEARPSETARFYTRARKFPKLIGRLHDGTRIPGGPYTVTQLVVLIVLTTGALLTRGIWGSTILVDLVISLAIGVGGAFAISILPAQQRNLLSVAGGVLRAIRSPAHGRYHGMNVRIAPPRHARGKTAINPIVEPIEAEAQTVVEETTNKRLRRRVKPASPATPAVTASVTATGVERLLAQTRK